MSPSPGRSGESPLFVVIQAGGVGTRLWPRSRRCRPKQLLDLVDRRTMLQNTVDRVEPFVGPERIYVVTGSEHAALAREQLPQLPPGNILVEPAGRGTGPSIGLAAVALSHLAPQGTMISLHADHVVADAARFRELLQVAAEVAATGQLVTLGIQPSYPETGYGYVERARLIRRIRGVPVYRVARFIEKPPAEVAQAFVRGRRHYWNAGSFVWRVDTILQAMQCWLPELHGQLMAISAAWGRPDQEAVLHGVWGSVESISIDVGIMENSQCVAVLPIDVGWSDVGSWATLLDLLPCSPGRNVVVGEHIGVDTDSSLLYSPKRLIATVGLNNMIVIDTEDAILICPKERAQEVKHLVEALQESNRSQYL